MNEAGYQRNNCPLHISTYLWLRAAGIGADLLGDLGVSMNAKKKSAPPTKHNALKTKLDTLIIRGITSNVKEDEMKKEKVIGALIVSAFAVLWLIGSIMEHGVLAGILRCLLTFGLSAVLLIGILLLID
ncbi:MAG: hypothetical protein ACRC3H_24465 [Lachnospiraceae bacterium]